MRRRSMLDRARSQTSFVASDYSVQEKRKKKKKYLPTTWIRGAVVTGFDPRFFFFFWC